MEDREILLGLDWKYKLNEVKDIYYETEDTIIIARDTTRGYKQYAVIKKDQLYLLKTNDINAYEVLLTRSKTDSIDDRVYRLYFDTELIIKETDIEVVNNIRKEFIKEVHRYFEDKFKSNLYEEVVYSDKVGKYEDIIDINASGMKDDGESGSEYKLSYHTILPIYFSNYSVISKVIQYIRINIVPKYQKDLPEYLRNCELIDKNVYTSNPAKSQLFRLPYQTKKTDTTRPLIPVIEREDYLDYLITDFKTTRVNINTDDLKDNKIGISIDKSLVVITTPADLLLDLGDFKKSKDNIISNEQIKAYLTQYKNDETTALVNIYLYSIINNTEHKQSYNCWLKIITNLKALGIIDQNNCDFYKNFGKRWTKQAYYKEYDCPKLKKNNSLEVKKSLEGFELGWESIKLDKNTWNEKDTNIYNKSLSSLRNYAYKSDKDIIKKIEVQQIIIRLYGFDISRGSGFTEALGERTIQDITFMPYENQRTLTTNENVSRAKTKAFFGIIVKYCRPHTCRIARQKLDEQYKLKTSNAKTKEETEKINNWYKKEKQKLPLVSSSYIIFSNRILFGEDFKVKLNKRLEDAGIKPAYFYRDPIDKSRPFLEQYSGIIVSMESLYKNNYIIKQIIKTKNYFTFFDEIETLLVSLTGNTRSKNEYDTMSVLKNLWSEATMNICADAYLSIKGVEFIKDMNRICGRDDEATHTYLHTNNYTPRPKTFNIRMDCRAKKETYKRIFNELKDKLRVVLKNPANRICIFCEEVKIILEFQDFFTELSKDPSYNFSMKDNYIENIGENRNHQTEEQQEHSQRALKDQTLFEPIRVWIYNTCIMNGVSVECVKFNYCYAIIDNFGSTADGCIKANDILNAIARARQSEVWEIYFYSNPNNNNIPFADQIIKNTIKKTKEANLITSNKIANNEGGFNGSISDSQRLINNYTTYSNTELYYRIVNSNTGKKIHTYYRYADGGMKEIKSKYHEISFSDEEYIGMTQLLESNKLLEILGRLQVNSVKEINYNLKYKKDIFIELAKLKYNIINDQTELVKDAIISKAKEANEIAKLERRVIKKEKTRLKNEAKKSLNYADITLELVEPQEPQQPQQLNAIPTTAEAIADQLSKIPDTPHNRMLLNNIEDICYKKTDKDRIDFYKILLTEQRNRKQRNIFNNINDYVKDIEERYKPFYIRELIRILRPTEINQGLTINPTELPTILTTTEIKQNDLINKTKSIFEIYYNSKSITKPPLKFITNINDLLYPIGLIYNQTEVKRETTGDRERIYTYKLTSVKINDDTGDEDIYNLVFTDINWVRLKEDEEAKRILSSVLKRVRVRNSYISWYNQVSSL
jgi:hypothetical protein